jgi:hypothetical protein
MAAEVSIRMPGAIEQPESIADAATTNASPLPRALAPRPLPFIFKYIFYLTSSLAWFAAKNEHFISDSDIYRTHLNRLKTGLSSISVSVREPFQNRPQDDQ